MRVRDVTLNEGDREEEGIRRFPGLRLYPFGGTQRLRRAFFKSHHDTIPHIIMLTQVKLTVPIIVESV